jgi:hypothetical protein
MSQTTETETGGWPDVHVSRWAGTKKSFHLYLQMMGKMRVALSPPQPNWLFTALYLSARGITTGPIPWRDTSFEATLDVFASELLLERSNGARHSIPLVPARTVAEIYSELQHGLETLGVECYISPTPQEVPDTTPLHEDRRPAEYDPRTLRTSSKSGAPGFSGATASRFGGVRSTSRCCSSAANTSQRPPTAAIS